MKTIKRDAILLCIIALIICGAGSIFYILQSYISVSYIMTAATKILFFAGLPLAYFKWTQNLPLKKALYLEGSTKHLKTALFLGIGVAAIVLLAYGVLQAYIDLDLIAAELIKASDINPETFPIIAVYIILGNSFLEEYFFRGFIFMTLYQKGNKKLAYIFSALLFSIYHVSIFKTWFNWIVIALALTGLFIGGIIFNAINVKAKSIVNSWIIHIFADIAIILIGIKMFYV